MKHFKMSEFEVSRVAELAGVRNFVPVECHDNVRRLVGLTLDPLREAIGRPIYITSGYRTPWLNREVGGADNSYHLSGMAADITTRDDQGNVRMLVALLELRLPFTELGIYLKPNGVVTRLHIALDPNFAARKIYYKLS